MAVDAGRPMFVVSSPRSGSTLFRLILDAHPRLGVPSPAWLMHYIYPYLYSYGDLGVEANLRELVTDALASGNVKNWPIPKDFERIRGAMQEVSFAGLYDALHRLYAESRGAARWGEKTPRNGFWMDELRAMYPDAQFVHILRDGRDVAIDLSDSDLWPGTVYAGAFVWRSCVEAIAESAQRLGPESFYEIRYENLCANPEAELRKLCKFLGEDFAPEMLAHHESLSTKGWAKNPRHAKTARPITAEFVGMYERRISAADRAALNAAIGGTLRAFGYPAGEGGPALPAREAGQLLEADMYTNAEAMEYKRWHENRRKDRRARGVWKDTPERSRLWGMC